MKSFVDFLTEGKKPNPNPKSSPSGGGSGSGKPPKNPPLSSKEIEAIKRQAQSDMGSSSYDWWDETDDNIIKNRNKNKDDLTKGGEVKTNKPQQKPLKKLIQRASKDQKARGLKVGDLDPKFSAELEAKRKARIDPKTGKATQQGVKNYAQNIGGYRRRNIPKDKLSRIFKYADNVARDPSSKEYKRIEAEINKSDYAGKRAKVSSIKQLEKIKSDIKTSKTINTRSAPLNVPNKIQTKTTKTPLNTSTRKGKIWNKVKEVIKRPTSTTSTKSTQASKVTRPTGKDLYTGGGKTPGGTNITTNISSNKTNIPKPETTKVTGMDSNVSGGGKTFKKFTNISNKTSNAAKLKITSKNIAGRVTGPAFAAWNFADNWKAAKGSPLRKTVKSAFTTTAYYKGFAGGAALGTAGGSFTGPGAFVTGTAGGLMGGNLAQKTASSVFNKIWKPPTKTKIKTNNTNKSVVGGSTSDKLKKKYTFSGGVRLGSGADPK